MISRSQDVSHAFSLSLQMLEVYMKKQWSVSKKMLIKDDTKILNRHCEEAAKSMASFIAQ
jgi:hypothetical protein